MDGNYLLCLGMRGPRLCSKGVDDGGSGVGPWRVSRSLLDGGERIKTF